MDWEWKVSWEFLGDYPYTWGECRGAFTVFASVSPWQRHFCQKVHGLGFDGTNTMSGQKSGVQMWMRCHSQSALFVHCHCHYGCCWQLFMLPRGKEKSKGFGDTSMENVPLYTKEGRKASRDTGSTWSTEAKDPQAKWHTMASTREMCSPCSAVITSFDSHLWWQLRGEWWCWGIWSGQTTS